MPRNIRKPIDPISDAITEFRISAKILIDRGNLRITTSDHEAVVKKSLERSTSLLTIILKSRDLDFELSEDVLAVTGQITKDNIQQVVSKIYNYRSQYITGEMK